MTVDTPTLLVQTDLPTGMCPVTRKDGYWSCIQSEHQDERHYFVHRTT